MLRERQWFGGCTYARKSVHTPVSLFGMSVSAANTDDVARYRQHWPKSYAARWMGSDASLLSYPRRWRSFRSVISLPRCFTRPGQFKHDAAIFVWGILAGSTVACSLLLLVGCIPPRAMPCIAQDAAPLCNRKSRWTILGYLCAASFAGN